MNKELGEGTIVIIEIDKRTYHYLTGLKAQGHLINMKVLGER